MKQKKRISSQAELLERITEVEKESAFYVERIQDELTSVSTYIPLGKIKESLNLSSFSDVTSQLDKHGLKLAILVPMFLNNTFFKDKNEATKALVTALSLVLDGNIDLANLTQRLVDFFSSSDGEKQLEETTLSLRPSKGIKARIFEGKKK